MIVNTKLLGSYAMRTGNFKGVLLLSSKFIFDCCILKKEMTYSSKTSVTTQHAMTFQNT